MENLNDEEYELFKRFNNLEGNLKILEIKALEKDINRYLKFAKKYSRLLVDILAILKVFELENEFSNFEYYDKITKTYGIADPVVKRLTYIEKEDLDPVDLVILQRILMFVRDFEEAQKLCRKALVALERYMSESPNYKKFKFFYHYNMIHRALRADFFELDKIKGEDPQKVVKTVFKHHLNEAMKICDDKNSGVLEVYEYILNVRSAIMDKDSESAIENLNALKEFKEHKKLYDMARIDLAEYSFHPDFELTEAHHNIAVGVRMRKLRERLGVTLSDVADKIGYSSEGNLSMIERGELGMTNFRLVKVAKIFGVTLEELCCGLTTRPREPLTKEEFKYSNS